MAIELTDSELRKTGINVIGEVRWGTHFCYFYEPKQDLLDTLVLYFKAGLENKEFCLWVVSQAAGLWLCLLTLALVLPSANAQPVPRTIRVVMGNAYAPYSFQSDDSKVQGILIDQRSTSCRDQTH